jgi:putative toxin-antitoxin system antitoxin component (TIGR02293 family)
MVIAHQVDLAAGREKAEPAHSERSKCPAGILLGRCVSFADRIAVYGLIERGIPAADVVKYASAVALLKDRQILSQVTGLSMRSLYRRARDGQRVNRDQTARILRFAQALDKATRVFGGSNGAEGWISTPAMGLDWASPIQMLINPVGFELVDEFLSRMEWGVYQ